MDIYLEYVKAEARLLGKEFFIDSGEGRTWGNPGDEWYVEDLTGWLVPPEQAAAFAPLREAKDQVIWDKPWSDMYCEVRWELVSSPISGVPPITVRFRYLPD